MENKRFTVVDTRTNNVITFDSTASTLGELKRDLADHNISYEDMDIQEGLTHIVFGDNDSAPLPTDVVYKGRTTNNLLFRLTYKNKKIKSGAMSRQEAYDAVKRLGLSDSIKNKYGRSYTMVKTELLEAEVSKVMRSTACREQCCSGEKHADKEYVKRVLAILIEKLYTYGIITVRDMNSMLELLPDNSPKDNAYDVQEYTEDEINDIFKDL